MRFDGVRIPLLDRHVARLARSAAYFSFPFDEERFRRRVERTVRGRDADTPLKVRTTLDRWGRLSVTTTPIDGGPTEPWRLTVADERVDRTDPFFYHKTTRRGAYDRALAAARADGYDEAVLLNQDGDVTEGTYTNLFVRQGENLWTPPVESGLLAGVYRDHVLETQPQASTRPLTLDDLESADAIYCCNGVRGWCAAALPQGSPKERV
jgi:para-aminobenzoate synthetase/4-amino-4-deoxychorismate lyase